MAFHLYSRGKASGVYLPLAPIFPTNLPTDIRWGFDAIWNISIITTTPGVFEYSLDGGTTFFPLITTVANVEVICNIKADDKDSFNLRTVGGATVFRILVSIAPEDIQRRAGESTGFPIPLPVDICPVNCPIDVNVLSVLPNPLPVSFPQPVTVTWPTALPVDICPVTCDLPVINGSVSPLQVSVANPQGTPVGKIILSLTNSAITANTDISGVDLPPVGTVAGDAVIYRVSWSADSSGKLSYTLDSINFVDFNNSALIMKEAGNLFDTVVEDGDAFNLRFDKNATVRFLRVVQLL
jgi:hypothetical protein